MSSFWRNFHHWLHWKLSFWQLPVQPVMNISSKWRPFCFSDQQRQVGAYQRYANANDYTVWLFLKAMMGLLNVHSTQHRFENDALYTSNWLMQVSWVIWKSWEDGSREAPLQILPVDNVNQIQGISRATSSIRCPLRKLEDRNISWRCVILGTLVNEH